MTDLDDFGYPLPRPTYSLSDIPEGREGVLATLKIMRDQVHKYKAAPPIRELALQICAPVNGNDKNYLLFTQKIFNFVQQKIGYIRDIRGVETIQSPLVTLQMGAGDCDDKSTLSACLLESIGLPTRFVAMGFVKGRLSHVITQVNLGRRGEQWVSLDCTENKPLGWTPPRIKDSLVLPN